MLEIYLFPAAKEFLKSVQNWQSYCHEFGHNVYWCGDRTSRKRNFECRLLRRVERWVTHPERGASLSVSYRCRLPFQCLFSYTVAGSERCLLFTITCHIPAN